MWTVLCFIVASLLLQETAVTNPQAAVDALADADRRFSSAGASTNVVDALAAMFADDIMLPAPPAVFASGKTKAIEALKSNPANLTGRVTWAPIRGGISADGTHGFTFGYMTMTHGDGKTQPWKYLSYWVKGPEGWRVAAYRRRPRPEGAVTMAMMDPSLPATMVAPPNDTRHASRRLIRAWPPRRTRSRTKPNASVSARRSRSSDGLTPSIWVVRRTSASSSAPKRSGAPWPRARRRTAAKSSGAPTACSSPRAGTSASRSA